MNEPYVTYGVITLEDLKHFDNTTVDDLIKTHTAVIHNSVPAMQKYYKTMRRRMPSKVCRIRLFFDSYEKAKD